jgi:hypothetical protein
MQNYYDTHADRYDGQMEAIERRLLGPQRHWAASRSAGRTGSNCAAATPHTSTGRTTR